MNRQCASRFSHSRGDSPFSGHRHPKRHCAHQQSRVSWYHVVQRHAVAPKLFGFDGLVDVQAWLRVSSFLKCEKQIGPSGAACVAHDAHPVRRILARTRLGRALGDAAAENKLRLRILCLAPWPHHRGPLCGAGAVAANSTAGLPTAAAPGACWCVDGKRVARAHPLTLACSVSPPLSTACASWCWQLIWVPRAPHACCCR